MAELEDSPKRSQALAQLERVCRIHQDLSKSLLHNPNENRSIEYHDPTSARHHISLDARFDLGLRKIRRALIGECYDQGFSEEITQILKQTDSL
jgi:hypothetical protein